MPAHSRHVRLEFRLEIQGSHPIRSVFALFRTRTGGPLLNPFPLVRRGKPGRKTYHRRVMIYKLTYLWMMFFLQDPTLRPGILREWGMVIHIITFKICSIVEHLGMEHLRNLSSIARATASVVYLLMQSTWHSLKLNYRSASRLDLLLKSTANTYCTD